MQVSIASSIVVLSTISNSWCTLFQWSFSSSSSSSRKRLAGSCTGNWDFGKLKGGDNEFHSLRTYQTAIERASNRRLLAPPDHTLHCGQNGIPKMATKKLKSTLMCKGVFNYSKNRTFVLQFANTKWYKTCHVFKLFSPLCVVVLCVWHSTYGKLNCFDFGMALFKKIWSAIRKK